jgi:sulfite reductase (NADPH) hemoprotein beta-component
LNKTCIEFPCRSIPAEPAAARLLGLYPMRQEGLFMQRVRVPGGALSAAQLEALADAAEALTPGYPLHLTTRQDVELHGARPQDVPALQCRIAAAGLSTVGSCGDTLRNVTTCPGAGRCPGGVDVRGVARAVTAAAEALEFIRALPRKFKISISGCADACARPFINDVGLVAEADGRFRAVVAGSLGARPGLGVEFPRLLDVTEAVPLVVGAIRLFNAEGDRANRGKARLRHVRERMGDTEFLKRLEEALEAEGKTYDAEAAPRPAPVPQSAVRSLRLHPPLGDIASADARRLAEVMRAGDTDLCIGFEHDLWLFGVGTAALGPLAAWHERPSIIACPGSTWCARGIADARAAATAIAAAAGLRAGVSICISGCPNNCSHAAVADIGLVGRIGTVDGARRECYSVFTGGGRGRTGRLARKIEEAVAVERVAQVVAGLAGAAG